MNTLYDRIFETTNTTGSVNPYLLLGALSGFKTFASRFSNNDKVHYLCTDDVDWEVGFGTIDTLSTPPQISRDTVLASSQADAAVNWGAGTRNIFCDLPAALLQNLFDYPQKKGPLIRTADNTYKSPSVFRENTAFATPTLSNWGDSYVWTGAATTLTLPAKATLTPSWFINIANEGTGTVTIDPDAAETIEGAATFSLVVNQNGRIEFDGTEFRMMFLSSPDITAGTGLQMSVGREITVDQSFFRGYFTGLSLTWTSVTSLTVNPGVAADAGGTALMKLSAAINKTLSGPWAAGSSSNGLFSGSRAANTWYHVFLIYNPTTGAVDVGFDTNVNAVNKPSGFVARRIGSVKTDGATQIIDFVQDGDLFLWKTAVVEFSGTLPTAATTLNMAGVPSGIPITALIAASVVAAGTVEANDLSIYPAFLSSTANQQVAGIFTSGSAATGFGQSEIYAGTAAQVNYFASTARTGSVATRGWKDSRGRFA